jgi:hypothetical protein
VKTITRHEQGRHTLCPLSEQTLNFEHPVAGMILNEAKRKSCCLERLNPSPKSADHWRFKIAIGKYGLTPTICLILIRQRST